MSPPAQVLAIPSSRQKTSGSPDNGQTEISGVQALEGNTVVPILSDVSGVHPTISGVHPTISGIHDALLTTASVTIGADTGVNDTTSTATQLGETDDIGRANSVYQNSADTLPDLVVNSGTTDTNTAPNLYDLITIPPVGDVPPDHIFDGATTEEDFDAVDALLSLGTVWTNISDDIDDNSTLMPIGGESQFVDVNPVRVQLDQVTVDGAIAQIVEQEQSEQNTLENQNKLNETDLPTKDSVDTKSPGSVVPNEVTKEQNTVSGIQDALKKPDSNDIYNADTEIDESKSEQPKKGYIKMTTHGIKKKSSTEGRSYRCTVCGKRKRSSQSLNAHHRRNHNSQMCGICGKIFELASTLTHHMYSHDK